MRATKVSVAGREGNGQKTEVGNGASAASGAILGASSDPERGPSSTVSALARSCADSCARRVGLVMRSGLCVSEDRSGVGGGRV